MDLHNLTTMANNIGQFFESYPDAKEARASIAEHIRKFWDPRMRRALLEQLHSDGCPQLRPLVREALLEHFQSLMPKLNTA